MAATSTRNKPMAAAIVHGTHGRPSLPSLPHHPHQHHPPHHPINQCATIRRRSYIIMFQYMSSFLMYRPDFPSPYVIRAPFHLGMSHPASWFNPAW
eukprot:860005-Pyramimonas_sp.AAC.1